MPIDDPPLMLRMRGELVMLPRLTVRARIAAEEAENLHRSFPPGEYRDPKVISKILNGQFEFIESKLTALLPRLACRRFLDFLFSEYDASSRIENLRKAGKLSAMDLKGCLELGPYLRRAVKYLIEQTCLLGETPLPNRITPANNEVDAALAYADRLARIYSLSDQTYMLFPNDTVVTIEPSPGYMRVECEPSQEYSRLMPHRTRMDVQNRDKFFDGPELVFDLPLFSRFLSPALEANGLGSLDNVLHALTSVIDGISLPDGCPHPFVNKQILFSHLRDASLMALPTIERLIAGFTVSTHEMKLEGRKLFKPKQRNRAFRRAFFEFPEQSGLHLAWSMEMAHEEMLRLISDLPFQHIPPEWESPGVTKALAALSNAVGAAFEKVCIRNLRRLGCRASTYKKSIGTGREVTVIPGDVGEIDTSHPKGF